MKTKKKIDELYRDKFKNVETTPPKEVWQHIVDHLPGEKPKRRILPLWYTVGGVAAALALLFLLINFFTPNSQTTNITNINSEETKEYFRRTYDAGNSAEFDQYMLRSAIILEAAKIDTQNKELIAAQNKNTNRIQNSRNGNSPGIVQEPNGRFQNNINSEEGLLNNAITESGIKKLGQEQGYTFSEYLKEETVLSETPEQEELQTLTEISKANNEVAELGNKDEPEESSSLSNRFSITTTAGAVYFDNLGGGNSLDEQFSNNPGSGEISMAYGVNLAYQLSEKIKIRSGVSKVNLSYNTLNVNYASAVSSRAINEEAESGVILSSASGSLNQSLGFVEIPLEMEYAIINRKLGLNLIGGASTLLLDKNMVSLNTAGSTTDLGEATNLNQTSFSANLGLGVNYKITPRFQMNLEPIFKYQINTFNNTSGLNAYYFGIYSGLSFKF